jgi:REP element-mobilizing transposase RayT
MSNVHRLRLTDRIFFVTVRLRRGVPRFSTQQYRLMIDVLEASRRRLGFLLCGYVLMSAHWHAPLWTAHPITISQVVHDIKKVSARRLNKQRGAHGPVWQHQFWDRFVRNAKEFSERMEYMHLNPVIKGLVNRPAEWVWSGANHFSLDAETVANCPIRIDYARLSESYRA